jgi:hypothetical protein
MAFIKQEMLNISDQLLASLPSIEQLTSEARRGIIARYSAVLEGNFIYWMTGAYLSAKTNEARAIIEENLLTEVRDCHPGMLRRFALAAYAVPSDLDTLAVYPRLSAVRHFVGRLSAVPLIAMMAFFENFIQGFMEYLANLATRQGSEEMEYTDVHGVCDIEHSEELFHALQVEMEYALNPHGPSENLFEGVYMLRDLIRAVISSPGIFKNVN